VRVAIVGAGFAGSILARVLEVQGHDVTLVEKSRHPRFAIGESSTPLAAICLERLADRYALPELRNLAAYGRWMEAMPHVRRGLKRGFTFYGHERNHPFSNTMRNNRRLLVAASPEDRIADSHWLRSDVDAYLAKMATDAGVRYLDRTQMTSAEIGESIKLLGNGPNGTVSIDTDVAIDAAGNAGFLGRQLGLASAERPTNLTTALVFGHFEGVQPFADVASISNSMPAGPYPDDRAAVHHLLREGWMYQLPFDHGIVSAGFLIEHGPWWKVQQTMSPRELWDDMLYAYPSLADQFSDAKPVTEIQVVPQLQRRLETAAGPNWALLPYSYAFSSPMFSTGIAWSLVAVERIARAFEDPATLPSAFDRYDALLRDEAVHLEHLVAGAYATRHDFDAFVEYAMLYFAAASFSEASQRLLDVARDGHEWCWDGFLGARDPQLQPLIELISKDLRTAQPDPSELASRIREGIASRNVAGLSDASRNRMYPVDLDDLAKKADLLGLTTEEIRLQLPRLRGVG